MALMGQLGYKQNSSSQRESFRNDSISNRQMTPYAQLNTPQSQFNSINNNNANFQNQMNSFNQSQQLRNRSQNQSNLNNINPNNNNNNNNIFQTSSIRNNRYNPFDNNNNNINNNKFNNNQENNNFLNNPSSSTFNPQSNTNSFFDQPQNNRNSSRSPNKFMNDNTSKSKTNKYSSVPKKSMRSSGLGYVSPIPPKYSQSKSRINDRDRLDLTSNNNNNLNIHNQNPSMTLNDNNSVPISPIKPNLNNNPYTMNNNTLPLNATTNTLNFGGNSNYGGNESRLSVQQYNREQNANHRTQIAIIGFPTGEAQFIHRKFRSYGTILKSEWSQNTLYLEYEHDQNATRALAENAKWIKHENKNYMIAVMYAEQTENNPFDKNSNKNNGGGRVLSFTEMYNESFNNPDRNIPTYFGGYNIERPPISRKHNIFWKIFEFITSGW